MKQAIASKALQFPVFIPNMGPVYNKPQEFLLETISPYSRNMEILNEMIQGRSGLSKFIDVELSGRVLGQPRLNGFDGTKYYLFCTPKDIYALDYGNTRYDILTPVYTTGQAKVVNGSAIVYGGLDVDDCDDDGVAWADGSGGDVTPARETSDKKDGSASVKLTVDAGAGVEILAYHNKAIGNLTAYDSVGFWFKTNVALDPADFQFLIDDTANCASPIETIDFPAVSADTWTWINLTLDDPSLLTAVASIGIKQAVDKGALVCYIDQIVAGDWAGQLGAGDYFKIGSGDLHTDSTWYEVDSVDSDTQITLTTNYAGSTADQQAYAVRMIFAGGNTDYWDFEQFLDKNLGEIVIMTNGVDTPVYWTGANQVVALTGLATGFSTAKYVDVYKDRVIFLNTIEGGANQPQRERWGDVANAVSYQDIDFLDFVDEPTDITGTARFAGFHIVFKQTNAYVGRWIGGTEVFDYDLASECRGARSRWSIIEHNEFLAYYGTDKKFHKWNLLQDQVISEPIFPETKEFDPNTDEFVHVGQVGRKSQIRWFCPSGSTDKMNYTVVWDYSILDRWDIKVWEYQESDATCSFGRYQLTDDVYADDPVFGALFADETLGFADDSTLLSNSAIILYGGYDGYVRIADSGTTDDGTTYTRLLRFKRFNFKMIDRRKRLHSQTWWLEQASAGTVTIKMRLDDSTDYHATTKTITLLGSPASRQITKQNIRWDLHAVTFQPEISSTNHFSLQGFVNYVFPKGYA